MFRLSLDAWLATTALIVAIIGVLYSRQMTPKRELLILPQEPTPLLHRMGDDITRITVSYGPRPVTDPYVTVLRLSSTGRNAITTEDFDQNRPLVVDIGAPIVDVLKVNSTRGSFKLETRDTEVVFGPDLLAKRDEVEVHLLTSGEPVLPRKASPVTHYLIDTRVEYVEPGSSPAKQRRLALGLGLVAGLVLAAIITVFIVVLAHESGGPTLQVSPATVAPGSTINVNLSHLLGNRIMVFFMGTEEPIHFVEDSQTLTLRVPRGTAPGKYIIAVVYSLGPFQHTIEKPFFVR